MVKNYALVWDRLVISSEMSKMWCVAVVSDTPSFILGYNQASSNVVNHLEYYLIMRVVVNVLPEAFMHVVPCDSNFRNIPIFCINFFERMLKKNGRVNM